MVDAAKLPQTGKYNRSKVLMPLVPLAASAFHWRGNQNPQHGHCYLSVPFTSCECRPFACALVPKASVRVVLLAAFVGQAHQISRCHSRARVRATAKMRARV